MINVIINNRNIQVKPNTTVFQACESAYVEVPRFCYHDKLAVAGNCRMCLVEIEKSPKPVVSCAMPVMEGMRIYTETPLVKKAREAVLEFLLINHPLDCPICDQGGECDLQDQTLSYGSDRSRFFEFKRSVEDKECGPIIKTIMTRCIHCTRCVRFAEEIAGTEELGTIGRGTTTEIGTYINKFIKSEVSGNMVDLCPVGALTSKPYAFVARSWELQRLESIDYFDAIGSNITINTRNNSLLKNLNSDLNINKYPSDSIVRILPRLNEDINDEWISDKTRFVFDGLNKQRLTIPSFFNKQKQIESNWFDLINYIKYYHSSNLLKNYNLKEYKKIVGIFGQLANIEVIYFLFQFLNELGSNNIQFGTHQLKLNVDIPLFYRFNSQIKKIDQGDVFLFIGVNPRFEASMINVRIRKQVMRKKAIIASIGTYTDVTYPILHLGNSTKTLINLSEGRHYFCQKLINAKNPIIICGTEFMRRSDSLAITNLVRFLSHSIFANLKTHNGFNILHSNIGSINSCELGAIPGTRSFLHLNQKKFNIDLLWLVKTDKINKKQVLNFTNNIKRTKTFLVDSHITENYTFSDFLIPTAAPYEESNILVNTEGFVQKSNRVVSSLEKARPTSQIFQAFAKSMNLCLPKKIHNFTNINLCKENPFLHQVNKVIDTHHINFLKFNENKQKIFISNFIPLISNFYMTDTISKNSQIMSECSLFLNQNLNFKNTTK